MTRSGPTGRLRLDDAMPEEHHEFTLRAVVAGLLIGTLTCCTNMSLGLQSGWVSMMSLQASLLGFGIFKVLPRLPWFSHRPLSVHENIVLQTTAVATGTLPLAAGFVGVIPALAQLNPLQDRSLPLVLSWQACIAWSFAVAFFGVFLAVPLRRQVIVKEQLTFPSGTATAQVIGVLHGKPLQLGVPASEAQDGRSRTSRAGTYAPLQAGESADDEIEGMSSTVREHEKVVDARAWSALTTSFVVSSVYTLLSFAFPVIYAIPIFDIGFHAAHDWLWWFTPSTSYIGQGIIMGFPTTASMSLGMIVGWAFLSPLSHYCGWAPGPVASTVDGARGWILWPALAVMCAESLISVGSLLATSLKPYFRARQESSLFVSEPEFDRRNSIDSNDSDRSSVVHEPTAAEARSDDEPSLQVVLAGLGFSGLSCVVLVGIVFGSEGIAWWATVIALLLASIFSVLGVRALGETDLNPVSAIGKLSQLLFAVVQPNNVVANLVAGGISEAGAQQSGDLMQDLKTGYLWQASPKAQFQGQLVGSLASVFVSTALYCLYRRVYEFPSTAFPVPTAAIWLNLARLVNAGELPPRTPEAMIVFGLVFVGLSSLKMIARAKQHEWTWAKWLPSGIAFAIGFINTPSFSLARLVGGLISLFYTRRTPSSSTGPAAHLEHFGLIIVASGFVLGEGFASVVGLLLKSTGHGNPISCWGCGAGGGGYCGGCP
ncbi:uncharacterized protein JCM15063_000307 [Sporobolomyces koalae]|uniref:uncharacterized protein n=1 Tax=Sporobolomyces koalae TaxID=500713 RepID=UPI00317405E2